jgi:dTDP-glucose pyrophosphorylase
MKSITDLKQICLSPNMSVRDAVIAIDQGRLQIALVLDSDNRLLGTITDGDVRRALLSGKNLESPIAEVMNRNFKALPTNSTELDALHLMQSKRLHQVPVIDGSGKLHSLFLLDDLLQPRKLANPVVIMAGGQGKRLRPHTDNCPKPMLPVGGKPMLEIIIQNCIDAGFRQFYLSVNYLKEQIKDYFADGSKWNISIEYLEESRPLGTAGALALIPVKSEKPLMVMNGDVLTKVDFARFLAFHSEQNSAASIGVFRHTTQIPYGVVSTEGATVMSLDEKPILTHYINAGIYLLNPEVCSLVKQDVHTDMPTLINETLRLNRRVCAFPIHEYWLDVGQPEALSRAHGDWQ